MPGRAPVSRLTAAGFLAGLAVTVAVSVADGGYFPRTWGWITISLASAAAIALILRDRISLGRLDAVALAALPAAVGWIALSSAWSADPSQSLHEAERGLIYIAALLAALLVAEREGLPGLLAGVAVGIAGVCGYSLGTRLFPDERIAVDPVEGTLLIDPLGYANALGILAAVGVLLSLGFAVRARAPLARALAAAAPALLLPTLYLTASRGAWIALAAGFGVAVLLDSGRTQLLATALALAPPAAGAVWLTARSPEIVDETATLSQAAHAGHRLAVAIALLAVVSAAAGLAAARVGSALRRFRRPVLVAPALGAVLLGLAVFAALEVRGRLGDRPDYWRVAWTEVERNPWLGSGAGTFERYWQLERPLGPGVLDAHSLYLESLAELGPLGLGVLALALVVPLAAAVRARSARLAAAAAGAYVAYLVHAGLDWDWEMPAVTIVGLFCAAAVLAAARAAEGPPPITPRLRAALLLACVALAALGLAVQVENAGIGP